MSAGRIVRCSDGHLFTMSALARIFTSVHLGGSRFARCPVDGKWRMIENVNANDLTDAQLQQVKGYQS